MFNLLEIKPRLHLVLSGIKNMNAADILITLNDIAPRGCYFLH